MFYKIVEAALDMARIENRAVQVELVYESGQDVLMLVNLPRNCNWDDDAMILLLKPNVMIMRRIIELSFEVDDSFKEVNFYGAYNG